MSKDINQRLRVLGDHLEQERLAAADDAVTVQVVQHRRAPRGRTLATAAAAALVAFGLGGTLLSRNAADAPAGNAAECPIRVAPSLFDGGVAMIVFIDRNATDSQIEFVRNAISAFPDVIDNTRVEYFDLQESTTEAQRVLADDPAALNQLLPALPTMFKLFITPTADPAALGELSDQFKQLPKILDVQTAPDLTEGSSPSGVATTYLPPPDTTG